MLHNTDFLHLRRHGYIWRRRVPKSCRKKFSVPFLSFSLRTHVLADAAERGLRITGLSDLCFQAETDMQPEQMTQLLTAYARFEIEAADRLRALTGRRTREAAAAAMALEAATRASLRDAIFLCDHSIAAAPIHDTAARLGIAIDPAEEDYAILADRMIRLMIEISDERERRSRGIFSEPQPYLQAALNGMASSQTLQSPEARSMVVLPQAATTTEPKIVAPPADAAAPQQHARPEGIVVSCDELTISYPAPQHEAPDTPPMLLEVWDTWFEARMRGESREGAYVYTDAGKATRFAKDSDTTRSTRKLIEDLLGNRDVGAIGPKDWSGFNDMIRRIPANHGKSPKDRGRSYAEIIAAADEKEARQ
ncbi:MAG: hypothetical protein Q4G24_16225 [Paracoccus sp. (in: a-proteobacteria)]|uniref:DUF6538 domain-containing protein n=1 Tax=Paracoccus sp. TaxID=267 RepID=UPI0026E0202D|nr:DUF6538 domain-containing protein [Paracoccus sp. (in: a-proteobacteria)]MDO5622993.1 hypothetical protein [Paracoccus sp. (in: a-proteobacteria)]